MPAAAVHGLSVISKEGDSSCCRLLDQLAYVKIESSGLQTLRPLGFPEACKNDVIAYQKRTLDQHAV